MTPATQPIVSVVIPCYNQGRFLPHTIESVLGQTYAAVEVIVVNDGSTDETASIVRTYPAVRYIEQRNRGAAIARNRGLHDSRGDYLIFLDADDRLLPHAVATQRAGLDAHPEWAFVTGHVTVVREDGRPADVPPHDDPVDHPYIELLRSNHIWTPGVVMYRRSVFDHVRPFDASAGGSADYELNIRIARRFPIGCHHQVVLEYRQHGSSMSADVRRMLQSAVRVRRRQRRYVRRHQSAERAWKAGIGSVQADFGGRLIEQVKADLRVAGRRGRALGGVLCLLRYYSTGVMKILSARITRAVALRANPSRGVPEGGRRP